MTYRTRIIIGGGRLNVLPRRWRTLVAYLTKEQLEFQQAAQFFLDRFGITLEVEIE